MINNEVCRKKFSNLIRSPDNNMISFTQPPHQPELLSALFYYHL